MLVCATLSSGCAIRTPDIASASDNLKQGLVAVSQIDPLSLRKLLTDNDELRKNADTLRGMLNQLDNPGVISVSGNSRVWFEVTGYTGQVRVDVGLDSDENKFIINRVLYNIDRELPITYNIATRAVIQRPPLMMPGGGPIFQPIDGGAIDNAYHAAVNQAVKQFFSQPFALPDPGTFKSAIDQRLITDGDHSLVVTIRPEQLDSHGMWALEYKAYVERLQNEEPFLVGRFDNQTCGCQIGQAKTYTVGFFRVKLQP